MRDGQVLAAIELGKAERLFGADCGERVLEHWRSGGMDDSSNQA